ncbi:MULTISPECIES: nuclear transport factor 2 family protein [Rhodococcus]|jgi:ketosteroid isomerase-like protein|uniref:nuclear transport factor 2 family protein n=1 Tax=Rhodococcus TaxID=1827 RepID=UPI0015C62C21|nr:MULTISPECIES: nuclear transport factor 2 family protein [Rhodococcus]MBV6761974.1 nuclear transport factor 2 family protein [Rhodococcus opacus]
MTDTISQTEQTRTVVAGLYAAGSAGDVEGLLASLAEDVVVHEPAYLPWGGTYTGHEQFLGLFGTLVQKIDLTKIVIEGMVAEGEKCFVTFHAPEVASGQDVYIAEQSTVRDGKVVELTIFYGEQTFTSAQDS